MQKINIKRAKNIWVPLQGNFCTPFAVWELDLEQMEFHDSSELLGLPFT